MVLWFWLGPVLFSYVNALAAGFVMYDLFPCIPVLDYVRPMFICREHCSNISFMIGFICTHLKLGLSFYSVRHLSPACHFRVGITVVLHL